MERLRGPVQSRSPWPPVPFIACPVHCGGDTLPMGDEQRSIAQRVCGLLVSAGQRLQAAGSGSSAAASSKASDVPFAELRVFGMPIGWNGTPMGFLQPALGRFKCFGKVCAAADRWVAKGTDCMPHHDWQFLGQPGEYQRMCRDCYQSRSTVPENVWPKVLPRSSSSSAPAAAAAAAGLSDSMNVNLCEPGGLVVHPGRHLGRSGLGVRFLVPGPTAGPPL